MPETRAQIRLEQLLSPAGPLLRAGPKLLAPQSRTPG